MIVDLEVRCSSCANDTRLSESRCHEVKSGCGWQKGRYFSGDKGRSVIILRYISLKCSRGAAEHEESSMVSTLSTQGQVCRPTAYNCRGEGRNMRLVRELGESEWDNG